MRDTRHKTQDSRQAFYSDLKGKVVVLTGGANGIGEAMVKAFHREGATVYFCDREIKRGSTVAKRLGRKVFFKVLDLRDEDEVVKWIGEIRRREKKIHVLINNAAIDPRISIQEQSTARWQEIFEINVRAAFLLVRESLPLLNKGASIINFGSITFHTAPAPMTAYVATKGSLLAFTRSLARELGPKGIRVNTISPGWVMTERQLRDFVDAGVKKLIRKSQCIPELIQPEEIAEIALFLASNRSRVLTGQEILADRGWAHS